MKFIKKHKSLIIAIIIFAIVFVLFLVAYRFFFPNEESAIYGDRLEGIEIVLVEKGQSPPARTDTRTPQAFIDAK